VISKSFPKQLAKAAVRFRTQLPYVPRALALAYRAAGALTIVWLLLLMVQGLLPVALVYLTKVLVDGVATVIASGTGARNLITLAPSAAAMGGVLIATEVLAGVGRWLRTEQAEKVQDHVHELIHAQAMRLDLSYYDDPGYYDQLHRARVDALSRPAALLENVGALTQSLITLIAMAGVLLTFGLAIPLVLALSTIPALLVVLRHTMRFHHWRVQNTPAIRKTHYYDMMLTSRDAAAEMRLFHLGAYFRTLFTGLRRKLRRDRVRLARDEAFASAGAALLGLAGLAGALSWMGIRAAQGLYTLGDLALFAQAFFQGQRMMRSLLGSFGEIYRNTMFLENLFEFLALAPRIYAPQKPAAWTGLQKAIEFRNIVFCYPGNERPALNGFNLTVEAGKITALVGENGAGKTTLIKLLCRFYDPVSGVVLADGTDLKNYSPEDLRRRITVLFQEPVRYADTVRANIALGDIESRPDDNRVEQAAKDAGADSPISRLPEGYQAILGKWFGGAELSGGEWQRLALARAFLRQADLILLDEPTSFMDSWAEADWLSRFRRLTAGRTSLIITHRFTTAMQADIIHVLDQGRVIESGSHEALLAAGGRYAASWKRQMSGGKTDGSCSRTNA